jgi:hypothetical protein
MKENLHILYDEILNIEFNKPWWKWMIVRDPELTPTVDEFDTFEDFEKYGEMFYTPPLKKDQ